MAAHLKFQWNLRPDFNEMQWEVLDHADPAVSLCLPFGMNQKIGGIGFGVTFQFHIKLKRINVGHRNLAGFL